MRGEPRIENLLRELAPQVLGVLVWRFGDFAAAEDSVQEALLSAASHWPEQGTPDNPRGWLIQTGSRKLLDQVRSEQARRRRESLAALREPLAVESIEPHNSDDTLTVLFMCCHPSLTPASAIALTLRAIGGLTTAEIANAFLVPEATMAQRISRAKQRIKASDVPFRMPERAEWTQRLRSVLHVLYLIFNAVHAHVRRDALDVPSLRVKRNDGMPAVVGVRDAVVELETPSLALRQWTLG